MCYYYPKRSEQSYLVEKNIKKYQIRHLNIDVFGAEICFIALDSLINISF